MNCFLVITLIAALICVVTVAVQTRNSLVLQREEITAARSRVVSSIKRRNSVLTHIVSVAVRYEEYEGEIVKEVLSSTQGLAASLASRGATIIAKLGMSYPALRASETYQSLMAQFSSLEGEVQDALLRHNTLATKYNSSISRFPINFLLGSQFQAVKYLDSSMELDLLPESDSSKVLGSATMLRKRE